MEKLLEGKKLNFKKFKKKCIFLNLRFLDEKCLVRPNTSYDSVVKVIGGLKIEF